MYALLCSAFITACPLTHADRAQDLRYTRHRLSRSSISSERSSQARLAAARVKPLDQHAYDTVTYEQTPPTSYSRTLDVFGTSRRGGFIGYVM